MARGRVKVEGLKELMRDIRQLEEMPQKQITKGVRTGTKVILKEAKAIAKTRRDSGKMWKKLTLKAEKTKRKGKKVIQVTYPKTERFQEAVKITKDGKRYYYPASQNFGFKTRRVKNGKDRVEGLKFFQRSMQNKGPEAAKVIVQEIGKEIEKMLSEGGR